MKKINLLLIALIVFVGFSNAQKPELNGVWLLSEMHDGDETYPVNMHVVFKDKGIIESSGEDIGTWASNEANNTLTITCGWLQFIEGINTIATINDSELIIKNTKGDINSFAKISLPKDKELNNDVTGEWMLESAETNGETNSINVPIDFNKNGVFYMQDRVLGTWDYNPSDKTVLLDTKKIKGKHSILKLDQKHLVIKGEVGTLNFSKIDRESILKENTESGLLGTWKINTSDNPDIMLRLLTFKSPDLFTLLEKKGGMTHNLNGTWQFSKTDQTLLLADQPHLIVGEEILKGLSKVISLTDKTLTFENNGVRYTMTKEEDQSYKIEHLTFTQDDFYTEEDGLKYEGEEKKLPWKDAPYEMIMTLVNVKQLIYKYSTLIEGVNIFESETLTANVNSNPQEQELSIDYIFSGYDSYNLPEDSELPSNKYNNGYGYNKLYPEEDLSFYRVVGEEEITTPAGTFNCAIVEAIEGFDKKWKIWMIVDKPYIFAKIIKENTDEMYGYYHIYELQEIK